MTLLTLFLSGTLTVGNAGWMVAPPPAAIAVTTGSDAAPFRAVAQPVWAKTTVTGAGLVLIGWELWWFLVRRAKPQTAAIAETWQELTITVDGGYHPSHVVVQAGQPLRLHFDRRDPNHCLDEVRFPDFQIAQHLPNNQVTAIEFLPTQPGRYEFTCGMAMFRGVLEVQPASA